jgi:hypothetical protein
MGTLVTPAFTTGTLLLICRVDALHVADLTSSPVLPADSLAQGPADAGQLTWRQAAQVMLDRVEPTVGLISAGVLADGQERLALACYRQ